ncbi:MAG: hypothetical protein JO257_06600 [Deltaproteobacteria bacterium]|nr:hypothetical protein [Deltaproteobacteria bacterium]
MRLACLLVLVAACSGDTALPMKASCNPLGFENCMVPWPSGVFEVDDASTATGKRLQIPQGTLPTNIDSISIDPTGWNQADGFSPAAPMVMAFPGGVSAQGLPPADNMTLSTQADSPTFILDMTTGQPVAHFAEIDMQADSTPDSQALLLRPAARLVSGHRYAVAITNRVKARDGGDLPVPPGFKALVGNHHTDHALLEANRERLKEALDALDQAGIPEGDLVVAWDFTVASDDYIHRDMIAARDRALAALQNHPQAFTITTDAPINDGSIIKRRITGTFETPLILTNGGGTQPGTTVARDAEGLPAVQGIYSVGFTAIVPTCAYASAQPVGMIIYGHGLMGSSNEAAGGVQQATANELCMVIVGTNMRGMSEDDVPAVARALNEGSHADEVMEVLEQGLVNYISLVHAMRTTLAQQLFVDAANGNKVLVDPSRVYYYGLSQGAIFGTPFMAYEPTVTRAVLGVGAANYSMLLDRSADWPQYRVILNGAYPDALDDTLVISLMQMRWDKTEGSGIANSVLAGTPTGTPPKQILAQIALSDEQVPNIGSYWEARTMNIPVLGPTPTTPWGLTVQQSPLASGSALLIMDGGAPPAPTTNIPAPKVEPSMHDLTRIQPATRAQMKQFYSTGQIVNECAGACVCTPQNSTCN